MLHCGEGEGGSCRVVVDMIDVASVATCCTAARRLEAFRRSTNFVFRLINKQPQCLRRSTW